MSGDGSQLFYHAIVGGVGIEVLDLTTAAHRQLTAGSDPQISPDGRWLAYVAGDIGRPEVLVRPFPDIERARWAVSVGGGLQPRWSRDGRALFYRDGDRILAAAIETVRDFSAQTPRLVFESPQPIVDFALHPDGRRLLALRVTTLARPMPRVILNWEHASSARGQAR